MFLSMAAGPRKDCNGYRFHAGPAVRPGRRHDPGLSLARLGERVSNRPPARHRPDGMDPRPGSAVREPAADGRRPRADPATGRPAWRAGAVADRRLLHAGTVLQSRGAGARRAVGRSEEHTSELQSLMRIPYAVFCLK